MSRPGSRSAQTDPELFARWVGPSGMETGVDQGYAKLDALLGRAK